MIVVHWLVSGSGTGSWGTRRVPTRLPSRPAPIGQLGPAPPEDGHWTSLVRVPILGIIAIPGRAPPPTRSTARNLEDMR